MSRRRPTALYTSLLVLAMAAITVAAAQPIPPRAALPVIPSPAPSEPLLAESPQAVAATSAEAVTATECDGGCIVRVAPTAAVPLLWQRGEVAYGVADSTRLLALRVTGVPATVVAPAAATVALYALAGVRDDQERLVAAQGAVLDRIGDVRLLAAAQLPLHAAPLAATGMLVEKIAPACATAASAGLPAPTIEANLRAIVAIGASETLPLGDRQWDGPGANTTAEFLYCRFAALGYTARYEPFSDPQGHMQLNVVARPPDLPIGAETTLFIGHSDALSPKGDSAPGADDNAVGIAAMLELAARWTREGRRTPIAFAAMAAEEPGLLGSAAYANQLARSGTRLKAVVNLDSIGIPHEGTLVINGNAASRWLYNEIAPLAAGAFSVQWLTNPNNLSDDESFRDAGFPAVMVTTHIYGTEPRHHTVRDVVEALDFSQIATITDIVWRWFTQ